MDKIFDKKMKKKNKLILYDRCLLWLFFILLSIGMIMILSSSINIGKCIKNDPFFLSKKKSLI